MAIIVNLQTIAPTKSKECGHTYISQGRKGKPILQVGIDKMILRHVYDKPFMARLPNGSEWHGGILPSKKGG
jgi:hypothetical protein